MTIKAAMGRVWDVAEKDVEAVWRKKIDTWNGLSFETKREILHSRKCMFCGGEIVTIGHGDASWETSCRSCDFVYDED